MIKSENLPNTQHPSSGGTKRSLRRHALRNNLGQFFLNQNDVILVKKKSMSCNRVFNRINRVFSSPIFSFNLALFQPQVHQILGRPIRPGRISKL